MQKVLSLRVNPKILEQNKTTPNPSSNPDPGFGCISRSNYGPEDVSVGVGVGVSVGVAVSVAVGVKVGVAVVVGDAVKVGVADWVGVEVVVTWR